MKSLSLYCIEFNISLINCAHSKIFFNINTKSEFRNSARICNKIIILYFLLLRAVIKISSLQVDDTSRQGIQQLGNLLGSIFLLFSYKSRRGSHS